MMKCPNCNGSMRYRIDCDGYSPVIVYICESCRYTTFGETYMTNNKATITTGGNVAKSNTETTYEPINSIREKSVYIKIKIKR